MTGAAGRVAAATLDSRLTPLAVIGSILLGVLAIGVTPREEEPQIIVPMIDIALGMPGASAREIEERLVTPTEKELWGLPGVEYLYSASREGSALITARFRVNEPLEPSLVKVYDQLAAHAAERPEGSTPPLVQLRTIDDVPFLALTLHSDRLDGFALRRLAAEAARALESVPDVARVELIGGERRQVRVFPDPARLASRGVSILDLEPAVRAASAQAPAGTLVGGDRGVLVEAGPYLDDARDLGRIVVGVRDARPVYLGDVADVVDGPEEPGSYVFFGAGPGSGAPPGGHLQPAVTIALAKRAGANATALAERVLALTDSLRGRLLPDSVSVTVTRNYGRTAQQKSNELIEHLLIATLSVVALIALAMGWRSSLVVGIAVPVTLALTLFIYFLFGYTLNRVTLFALIFSIGILVDDAIVVVENIHRHHAMRDGRSLRALAVDAVAEVGNPTILATFTVIAAILPMAFVRGLMGPYMRPIPVGASMAMLFSLAVAFVVSPWAAVRLLKGHGGRERGAGPEPGRLDRLYRSQMRGLIERPWRRFAFLAFVVALLAGAGALVWFGAVKVKMLPFDNKSEFQVLLDLDEGAPVETTLRVAQEVGRYLATVPEVTDYQIYAGTAAPVNFNGLVRHYFFRQSPHGADIQVNLADKADRSAPSHTLARRVRPAIAAIAQRFGARAKVVEIPPGPPVLSTMVAEIYGPDHDGQIALARRIRALFEDTPGVVDIDTSIPFPQPKQFVVVDREKASLHGVAQAAAVRAFVTAVAGVDAGLLHAPREREPVPIRIGFPAALRSRLEPALDLRIATAGGGTIRLGDLATVEARTEPPAILHKNLKRVVYVFADLAGEIESPVYAISRIDGRVAGLEVPGGYAVERFSTHLPDSTDRLSMKWDGEWHITYEVFRDLGVAFALVLVLIYMLVVGWFESFVIPLVIMVPIPLSLVGILPGHWLFGAFFTATSMIGFIAGAGIMVRNSIILVDFIERRLREGIPLEEAVVDAGAIRFRPMLLTAAAVVVGSSVILFDPIFQGLALSLMMGEVAATLLSRVAVPVLYYVVARRGHAARVSRG
ncbi:MAG: efflux RND transporter permease subunit [Acidobacteria bacterium]|nr:efflux RND transporter permease subunit [Acidobacteriota bacterium]